MGLFDGLAEKLSDRLFTKIFENPRYSFLFNNLSKKEKEKFLKFARGFMKTALNLGSFISFSLITFYLYNKLGVEKLGVFLLLLIFMQLSIINQKLSKFERKL